MSLESDQQNIDFVNPLDCADLVFFPLPQLLLRRLQRVQFAVSRFVLSPFVKNFRDVLKIGWLPINERRDLNLLKSCFKALHNTETWPDYLKIIKQECLKELPSSNSIRLVVPTENGTFQDNASKLFNNLPETTGNCKDYRTFLRLSRNFLCNRVFILFIYFIILPHRINYKQNRKDNKQLINIKFKMSIQLGRNDCGGEISEKQSL